MQCSHCNHEHPEGSLFCPLTGEKIITPVVCPECGKSVDPKWRHCTHCGRKLIQADEVPNQQEAQATDTPRASIISSVPSEVLKKRFPQVHWLMIAGGICGSLIVAVVAFKVFLSGPSPEQATNMTVTAWTATSAPIPATLTRTRTSTPIPTRTRIPTRTPPPLPTCTQVAVIDEKWQEVARSDDMVVYFDYFEENPDTEHIIELRYLVDRLLRIKIDQAAGEGRQIIQNAKLIPGISGAGVVFGYGSKLWLGGGYWPQFVDGIDLYSDPTAVLAIRMVKDGAEYVEGRGIFITEDKVYVMGLPSIPIQPSCQR
jgi:hypothetical protein